MKKLLTLSLYFVLCTLYFVVTSCDDSTDMLGVDLMPTSDFVTKDYQIYNVKTESYAVGDHVLARTTQSYFGRFTDPETETVVESDFLAQFHCPENFAFPETVIDNKITSTFLRLFINGYVGDSLTLFKMSVYPLDKIMNADDDFYTDINPADYYDESQDPIAVKWFSISDRTITDDERSTVTRNITIPLPVEIGQTIYDDYLVNKEHFSNTQTWMNSGLPCSKGFYFKLESGDGVMAYIGVAQFNLGYRYYDDELAKDTLGVCQFASTSEVVQATRFDNSHLDKLLANTGVTYLKSPAGLFTQATLPVDEINDNDTINSAQLTFRRYNDLVSSSFKLSIPQKILLVRLDDYLNGFFENYRVADGITSYLAAFNSSRNTYEFSNIARLITTIKQEKKNGTATANAEKVLLIPVETTYDKSGNLVRLAHDFSMSSAKLVGGTTTPVELKVIYSHYNK